MASNVTVTSTSALTTAIPTPDDTEGATGAGLDGMVQPLLNNDAFLDARMNVTGVKIWRTVADIAALKALTGMAQNEIVLVGDVASGFNLFAYHASAAVTGDDVLIVTPTSGVGRWLTVLYQALGVANGIAVYNTSGKLALGKVTNQIYEVSDATLGSSANVTSTSYTTALSKSIGVTAAAGDKILINAHGNLTATLSAGICMSRLSVSENGGADIALPGTEDGFDNSTRYLRSYSVLHTVVTGGTFEVRWQIKSGVSGNAATLAVPAGITVQVIRP